MVLETDRLAGMKNYGLLELSSKFRVEFVVEVTLKKDRGGSEFPTKTRGSGTCSRKSV